MKEMQSPLRVLDTEDVPHWSQCREIWDIRMARFTPCFLPTITVVPSIVAVLVLFVYVLQLRQVHQPRQEMTKPNDDVGHQQTSRLPVGIMKLLVTAVVGLVAQVTTILLPSRQVPAVLPSLAWGIAILLIIVERPRKAHFGLLTIFAMLFVSQSVVVLHSQPILSAREWPLGLALVVALIGTIILLNLPMRSPPMPTHYISPIYSTPTAKLRSPEDSLTPWQYMFVTWIGPLIDHACRRGIGDGDVWSLPWEFKHARLYDASQASSEMTRKRLLFANGIDLICTCVLDILQLALGLFIPVLVQHLLISIKDSASPPSASITYALITVFARAASCQICVFGSWYKRRVCKRSWGHITSMVFKKASTRKALCATPDNSGTISKTSVSVSTGTIPSLICNDADKAAKRLAELSAIITQPVGAILATILIWRMLGTDCLLGLCALAVSQLINVSIVRIQKYFVKKRRAATDDTLQRTHQFLEAIRPMRCYGWQEYWMGKLLRFRQKELRLRTIENFLSTLLAFTQTLGSALFPVIAFYAFTTIAREPLRVDLVFPVISLFDMLESYLRALLGFATKQLKANVAFDRIEKFLAEPDREETDVSPDITLCNASFAWPGVGRAVLKDITLTFPPGLSVIFGGVATGKTAFLQALLGEMELREGTFARPEGPIAYCAQTPWLQSKSIRDNILFSHRYQKARYKQVLEACALKEDLAAFKHGDLTEVGENGIGLSGGQKARVSLARAVYSSANLLLLDDPLSALDHSTAKQIVDQLLAGSLLEGRTTLLVTHRTGLCHGLAKQWVEIRHDRIALREPAETIHELQRQETNEAVLEAEAETETEGYRREDAAATPSPFTEEEVRAKGSLKWKVYWRYIKAGTLHGWLISIVAVVLFHIGESGQTYFIKAWSESYTEKGSKEVFSFLPPADESALPWIQTYLYISIITSMLHWATNLIMLATGSHATKTILQEAFERTAHATFEYYNDTGFGRVVNRLNSDMSVVDDDLSTSFRSFVWSAVGWISAMLVILSVSPAVLGLVVLLCCGYLYYFIRFLPTSQALMRLKMASRSSLVSNLRSLVEGLTTIRAFHAEPHFRAHAVEVIDNFQKHDHFFWSLQSWLALRFSALSAVSTLVITLVAIYTDISPGFAAFVLIHTNKFVKATESMCQNYGDLITTFSSAERVMELSTIDQERPGVFEPPACWPTRTGNVEFDNVTIRHSPNKDPALHNVTLTIPAGSNTVIVGRTGSGKSTLAQSLLGTTIVEAGVIKIDGINISQVKKQALRTRVTFLAQDPTIIPGTMRENLDPFTEYSEAACESVLAKVTGNHEWTLSTPIEGKKDLSQGQCQLIGLARAMLRRSRVVIMDEATASLDIETARRIQKMLREEMQGSTLITIAHRLEAVEDADYCIVLKDGKVLRQGMKSEVLGE